MHGSSLQQSYLLSINKKTNLYNSIKKFKSTTEQNKTVRLQSKRIFCFNKPENEVQTNLRKTNCDNEKNWKLYKGYLKIRCKKNFKKIKESTKSTKFKLMDEK